MICTLLKIQIGCCWQPLCPSVILFSCHWFFCASSGRFLTAQQTCMPRCPPGTFANKMSSQCEECSKGCVMCLDAQHCQRCRNGLYLHNGVCVVDCQRWLSCFLISWLTHEHASSQHASDASFFSLFASVLEGFLKVVHASHVPQSAHPAREIPLIAWAVRQTICCWTTPAGLTVCRATTPQRLNVSTVQLTVETAIREACVRVSMLAGGVRSWEIWRCGEND